MIAGAGRPPYAHLKHALEKGKTPSGIEVRTILKHVIKRIRAHWPKVQILVRGDSHYGRHEAMEWCEIASKPDPAGKERMSLIARVNTVQRWGQVSRER